MLAWTTPKAKAPLRVVNSTAWQKATPKNDFTDGKPSFAGETLTMANPHTLKNLLEGLLANGWLRAGNTQDDPLDHLFGDAAKQWVLLWHPGESDLYLLFREQPQWMEATVGNSKQNAANEWRLYRNGQLAHQHRETAPRRDGDTAESLCQQVLDKQLFTGVEISAFLSQYLSNHEAAAVTLLQTLQAQPEVLGELKEALFWMLENGLQTNRLTLKNSLVRIFKQLVESNLLHTRPDRRRLDRILRQVGQQYSILNLMHRFRSEIQQAHWMFQTILTDGLWRQQLSA
ncbi:MAG: hypothetical protein AB7P76_02875 [Candidatus Melainabacteria bacterium]